MGAAELRNNRPAGVCQITFLYREAVCMDTVFPSSGLSVDCQFKVFISNEQVPNPRPQTSPDFETGCKIPHGTKLSCGS